MNVGVLEFPHWPYEEALTWMEKNQENVICDGKAVIAVAEHDRAVITLGKHTPDHQILSPSLLADHDVPVFRVQRGGGATLHLPGQLAVYPILPLRAWKIRLGQFVALLEDTFIQLLKSKDVPAYKHPKSPGVYLDSHKIGFIGLYLRRGVCMHGMYLNVNNDCSFYSLIEPCGQKGALVSSLAQLGFPLDLWLLARQAAELLCKQLSS